MARCPKCPESTLEQVAHTALIGLATPPARCPSCQGMWLRDGTTEQLKSSGLLEQLDSADTSRREQDKNTGLCPDGHGIMIRARVTHHDPFFLERCGHCHGIWLDAGEWTHLASENLLDHVDEFWSPRWRRRLREEAAEEQLSGDLTAHFVLELHERLDALASELAGREDAPMALAYLRQRILDEQHKKLD
jgi:Zn-finger nucleic acid-binding protein